MNKSSQNQFLKILTSIACCSFTAISVVQAQTAVDASDGVNFGTSVDDPKLKKGSSNTDLELDLEDGSGFAIYPNSGVHPSFLAGQGHEASVTAGKWYRIAQAYGRSNASFRLRDDISSGGHSTAVFRVGVSFGEHARAGLTLLSHTSYQYTTFSEVRILEKGTYDTMYLEVKVNRTGNVRYSIHDNISNPGWVPVDWVEVSSIPSGYSSRNYNIDKVFMAGDYKNRFSISRGGAVNVDGPLSVLASPVVTQSTAPTLLAGQYIARSSNNAGSVDSFLMEGALGGTGVIPVEGAGSRMMWYPEKSAFRVGTVNSTQWDNVNVGSSSVGIGDNTTASGLSSTSLGLNSRSIGDYSTAIGGGYANGYGAVSLGTNSYAMGQYSIAGGLYGQAMGYGSIVFGNFTTASGDYSASLGAGSNSYGVYSSALGSGQAYGTQSTALSAGHAYAFGSLTTGYNNPRYTTAGQTLWQGDDQNSAFEVGIGSSTSNRKNGLTVLQDGSVEVGRSTATDDSVPLHIKANGDITLAKPQGDISMGVFGQ